MIDKIYKKIVRFLIDHHIAIIDFGSENEVDEFYGWLNSDKSQKQKSSLRKKVIKICAWGAGGFAVVCLALMLICNQIVENKAEGLLLDHEFPWEDVDSCMNNHIETPIEGLTHCPECGKKLLWIRFYSPSWTWQKLCGRAGPLAICEECHKQVYFKCEIMN